jgi:hypothetical protein
MRTPALLAISLFVLGCQRAGADEAKKTPTAPPKPAPTALDDHAGLLAPVQVDSLTLIPIVATAPIERDPDMMVLDEAFDKKLLSIKEQESESVNQLTLTNKGKEPLFVLAGEVIIGGKQDRIIGQNTIINANATVQVPVFCVEHGRWQGDSKVFSSGRALAHSRLRGNASFENQGEVWKEVAQKNAIRKTTNSTDTYRDVAKQQTNGTFATTEKRVAEAIAKVPADDRAKMLGYVVALNGKVTTVDLFGSPKLFRKLENKLVRSYITDAVDLPVKAGAKPPTVAEVKAFMAEPEREAAPEAAYETDMASTTRYKAGKSAKGKVEYKPSKAMDKKARPIYETTQSKE